jgi:hypothetical protein
MMGNEYYNPQFNTNMYGQTYGQPMQDRLMQMRQQYQPTMNQPMMPMNQGGGNLIRVLGEAEAKGYLVAPGNTVVLFDSEKPMVYQKSVDVNGIPSMRYFQITEVHPEQIPATGSDKYVLREEFDKLVQENNKILAMMQEIMEKGGYYGKSDSGRRERQHSNVSADTAAPAVYAGVSGEPMGRDPQTDRHIPDSAEPA